MRKLLQCLVAAVIGLTSGTTTAAVITVHSSGVINTGRDPLGLFGQGYDLNGLQFSQSFFFETASTKTFCPVYYCYEARWEVGHFLGGRATVGGVSFDWNAPTAKTVVSLWDFVGKPTSYPNGPDQAFVFMDGYNADNRLIAQAATNVYSTTVDFVHDLDFSVSRTFDLTKPGMNAYGFFAWNSQTGYQTYIDSFLDSASWEVTEVAEVPEPLDLALFVLGAILLGSVVRQGRIRTSSRY
jgi:hypothetical protein